MSTGSEFALLQRLATSLANALTPEEVIAVVAEESLAPLGAVAGFVALLSEEGTELEIRRALGAHERDLAPCGFSLAAGVPTAEAVRTRQSIFVADAAERSARYPSWSGRWSGYGAWAAIPLGARDRMLGAILLCFAEPRRFEEPAVQLIETVAALCAQALHRALLLSAAQDADRRKDEFLAILGHELRNPLAPIQTALELLRMRGSHDREIDVMQRQVRHLSRLVDDLMDVSRITRGKIVLEKEPVDVRAVAARAVEMAAPLFEHKSQHVKLEAPDEPVLVEADPVRLAQVLSNLLTNAAKYTPTAGHVSVRVDSGVGAALVAVRDDGAGIAPDMLPHVFELFVQGPRALDRAEGGLGIGLTLVRSLVELHGGNVEVRSNGLGSGSEFVVRLPLSRQLEERTKANTPPSTEISNKRVLLVDDNADAAQMIAEVLGDLGYRVSVAHDAVEALRLCAIDHPDVALLDIGLPVMDGYELAQKLRELDPEKGPVPRLIAITGYGQEADRRRSHKAGFAVHLTKPVTMKEIVAAIEGK